MPTRKTALADAQVIGREDFITNYWDYRPGEHVTALAPTQWGKTTLLTDLMKVSARKELPAMMLIMKPRDRALDKFLRENPDFRKVERWPPSVGNIDQLYRKMVHHTDVRGYALWPKHTFDPDYDADMLHHQFRTAMMDAYKRGNRIVMLDELSALQEFLGMKVEPKTLYWQGAGMGVGVWGGTQRPAYAPVEAYGQCEHMFIARDPDKRSRDRYREIGGVDPDLITYNLDKCERFQWLYLKRTGSRICIVDK